MKITEKDSPYRNIEKMTVEEILININNEDKKVAYAVEKVIPDIKKLIDKAIEKIFNKGRIFYIGSGTSGRLGIVDASECPPTFGVNDKIIIGIIAGGDKAIRKAKEFAEDNPEQAWKDLKKFNVNKNDIIIGISASGTTPYVVGALKKCKENNICTASISCNKNSLISKFSDYPIEVITGPEFITGSTRMKAGTAQKLILNMISTTVMIKLGRILDNKMVDMQLSNNKLINRGIKIITNYTNLSQKKAKEELLNLGSVRKVLNKYLF